MAATKPNSPRGADARRPSVDARTGSADTRKRSVDARTRRAAPVEPVDPNVFWETEWLAGLKRHGSRAAEDAARLALPSLCVAVGDCERTLRLGEHGLEAVAAPAAELQVALDAVAFAEWVQDERTALGLAVAGRVTGDARATEAFCAWDAVLRSVLDGRPVYREGELTLVGRDGGPLDLGARFRLGEDDDEAGHFLQQTGFLRLEGVLERDRLDAIDEDFAAARAAATRTDGTSWWAATDAGERYPCRLLDFSKRSAALREFLADERYRALGQLLDDGHVPGDPFGEHFAEPTAEGLTKRVGSVEGLVCLPWHRDCERGGHSRYCSGMTVGVCLTPIDEAHGGLEVIAGSHRKNLTRRQLDAGVDLPAVPLRARRGDLTIHLSCAVHRSTHPTTHERRVVYAGLTLPTETHQSAARRSQLEQDRSRIGELATRSEVGLGADPAGRSTR